MNIKQMTIKPTIKPSIWSWLCRVFILLFCAGSVLLRAHAADDSAPRSLFFVSVSGTQWHLLKLPGDDNMMVVAWDKVNKNPMCLATVGEGASAGYSCRRPKNTLAPEDLAKLINLIGKRDNNNQLVGTLTCDSANYVAVYGKVDVNNKDHWCVYGKAVLGPDTPKLSAEENRMINDHFKKLEQSGQYPVLDRSSSLAGPDVNHNGVRDDIEAWINKNWTDPKENKAVMQLAKMYQVRVTDDRSDVERIRTVELKASDRAIDCMTAIFPNDARFERAFKEIKAFTLNTKERIRAFLAYDLLLSGTASPGPEPADKSCDP